MTAVLRQLDNLEIGLCLKINRYGRKRWVRRFFSVISRLGDGGFWSAIGISLILHRGTAILPQIAQIAVITLVGTLIYKALKKHLVRERPYMSHDGIQLGARPLDRYSFPSGHTMHAVSLTLLFAVIEPALLFITLPFALLVAMSRVVLGLHYPSDVVAGAALGAAIAFGSLSLF